MRAEALNLLARYTPDFFLSKKLQDIKLVHLPDSSLNTHSDISNWVKAHKLLNKGEYPNILLMWYDNPSHENFGDWLSPYIIKQISGQKITHLPDYCNSKRKHIVGIGSIANRINEFSHVFGTGISSINDIVNPHANFHFVRGPYTRKNIMNEGGPKVEFMGDMGFILSKLYKPLSLQKEIEVLFVRHVVHQSLTIQLPDYVVEHTINISDSDAIQNLVDKIVISKLVITSAMHCYIACKSYGVPVSLVTFENSQRKVFGDGIKYRDAMEGVGLQSSAPLELPLNLTRFNFENIVDLQVVNESILNDLHAKVLKSINAYRYCD